MDTVLSFISEGIHLEYEEALNSVGWDSSEGGYLLATSDAGELLSDLGFGDDEPQELFDDLVSAFSHDEWVHKNPYSSPECDELTDTWGNFCEQVKHKSRFLLSKKTTRPDRDNSPEPIQILETLGRIVTELNLIMTIPAGVHVYRARQHSLEKKFGTAKELGTPPKEKAKQSRMSAAGVPAFYGANEPKTAYAEIFSEDDKQQVITLGVFKTLRPLRLLDLTDLPDVPSLFSRKRAWKRMSVIFMKRFEEDLTKPVEHDGSEHYEYVPTQFVAEYFREIFQTSDGAYLDGILFNSSKSEDGTCCTFFCTQEECTDNPDDRDKKLVLIACARISPD
jgi:hypothetical protein